VLAQEVRAAQKVGLDVPDSHGTTSTGPAE
jgi:hypothetical protein